MNAEPENNPFEQYDELQDWLSEHVTEWGSPEYAAKTDELRRAIAQLESP